MSASTRFTRDSHFPDFRFTGNVDRILFDPVSETMDPVQRRAHALKQLENEWARAWELPFYRELYGAAGLRPGAMPALDEIPLVRKSDWRRNDEVQPPFGTHRAVQLKDAARLARSGGTTGRPWYVFYTRDDIARWQELEYQHHWRYGLRPGMHFTHCWPGYIYPTNVLGGRQYVEMGVLELHVGMPISQQEAQDHLQTWREVGIDAILCTLHQLYTYDDAARAMGFDIAEILEGKILLTMDGASQHQAPRRRIEKAYGVRLHNLCGTTEGPGFICSDNIHHSGLNVPSKHYWVQVCDPITGREVEPGTPGHMVINSFGMDNFMLRYDLEDIVVEHREPCPSGATNQRITLLGRGADMADVQGKKLLPVHVQLALEDLGAPEFVIRAGKMDELYVKVEHDDANLVRAHLSQHLQVPVTIDAVAKGSIPRSSYKPRRLEK